MFLNLDRLQTAEYSSAIGSFSSSRIAQSGVRDDYRSLTFQAQRDPGTTGRGVALCPAHEDRNPSLSIREAGGKILVYCHAGCSLEAVCTALGFEIRELSCESGPARRIEATYSYCEETGKLLKETVRYAPKAFGQRRPDGRGGWIWTIEFDLSFTGCRN